ncbi:MAG: flagellar export chaperone FliS [Synergistaceae bacterium]|nr:flagellar export chaperone FliS [Synergistaceae bacterium]
MINNNNNAQFTYQATRISTATKEQLLLITYDIGIKACRTAENALSGKNGNSPDYDLANREIIRAQEVIRELMVTLNKDKAGEMGTKLMQLYEYMYQQLVDANMKKEPDNIKAVREMLEELKATWENALVQLLQDYQAAHPEDKDLQNAMNEIEGKRPESQTSTTTSSSAAAPTAPAYKAPAQAQKRSFTLAG